MGIVSEYICHLIAKQVEDNGILVTEGKGGE